MNLRSAIEMGFVCGLTTIDESINNVLLHVMNLFYWPHIELEVRDLLEDYQEHGNGLVTEFLGPVRCLELEQELEQVLL